MTLSRNRFGYQVRHDKDDPDHTRIIIGGNCIGYPGDVGTNTTSLELFKLLLNSVIYCKRRTLQLNQPQELLHRYPNARPRSMSTSKSQTSQRNSLRSTSLRVKTTTVGSTLKFAKAAMAFPRPAFWPTISSDPAFLLLASC